MSYYTDEFLSAKQGSFKQIEFNSVVNDSLGNEVCEVLNSFGVKGQLTDMETGPCITSVYFTLDRGVRFNSIEPLSDDLKMSLGTDCIKIRPAPEKKAVAIEIPNPKRITIPFGNVFHSEHGGMILPAALGVDTRGNPIYLDIASTPHLLIAGQTGGGKSVCQNSIITSLALNCRPTHLQFLLIDPKGNEFIQYKNLSNLISGRVIDDVETALNALKWLVQEMECRYKILTKCGCRDIDTYIRKRNLGLFKINGSFFSKDMPRIVVVIDEYADLMMRSSHDLQDCVKSLGQKARAIGIHLILATQRPSAKIIDGDIKSNLPTRIALKVASITDSKTILDYSDAEKLLGKGDMLLSQGGGNPQRIHGCYISDDNIDYALTLLPPKKLYQINEDDVFNIDVHSYCKSDEEVTWGEANAVCAIILDHFEDFLNNNLNDIRQLCVQQYGFNASKINTIFNDIHNALQGNDFRKTINQLCEYEVFDQIPPFIKAAIYSSHLNFTNDDNEQFLFFKFIIKQAFINDDSAALESVRSFYNTKTYYLDYIKEEILHLCENDNMKAKEFLDEVRNNIVEELEEDYGNIDEYPNKESFKHLLAEAYPPLIKSSITQKFIINEAESGNEICEKIIYAHSENEVFSDYIIMLATTMDDSGAREFIIDQAEKGNEFWSEIIYGKDALGENLSLDYIIEMADDGDEDAIDFCIEDVYDLKRCGVSTECCNPCIGVVIGNAYDGNEKAIKCVCDNYEYFKYRLCLEYIKVLSPLAQELNSRTAFFDDQGIEVRQDIVSSIEEDNSDEAQNLTFDEVESYIIKKAKNAVPSAWCVIENNLDINTFYEFVWENRLSCKNAQKIVYKNLWDENFQEFTIAEAQIGDDDAKAAIYTHPEIKFFQNFIIDNAERKDERALDCIYKNSDVKNFQNFIIKDKTENGSSRAQKVIYTHPQIGSFQQYILREAEIGDDDAIDTIYKHPKIEFFNQYILDYAILGTEDAIQTITENFNLFATKINKLLKSGNKIFIQAIKNADKRGISQATTIIYENIQLIEFQKYILEKAKSNNAMADKAIFDNPEIKLFQDFIIEKAHSNNPNAASTIFSHPEIESFQDFIIKNAYSRNPKAVSTVFDHPEIELFQNFIIDTLLHCNDSKIWNDISSATTKYQKIILETAHLKNVFAQKIIFDNPQIEPFRDFILKKVQEYDLETIQCIFQNKNKCFDKQQIIGYQKFFQEQNLLSKNKRAEAICSIKTASDFQKFILELVRSSDQTDSTEAKNVIFSHPEIHPYREFITECAKIDDKDAWEVIFAHPVIFIEFIFQETEYNENVVRYIRDKFLKFSQIIFTGRDNTENLDQKATFDEIKFFRQLCLTNDLFIQIAEELDKQGSQTGKRILGASRVFRKAMIPQRVAK